MFNSLKNTDDIGISKENYLKGIEKNPSLLNWFENL